MAVFVVSFVVFALSPVITNYDSFSTFPTAVQLVNHRTLSLDAYEHAPVVADNYTVSKVHGRLITGYPWPVAVFFVPTVVAIDLVHVAGGPSADHLVVTNDMGVVQMGTASLVTALACAVLTWLAFERFRGSPKRRRRLAVSSGLAFAFGTSAWSISSRSMWQHGPSLLLLGLGLVWLDRLMARGVVGPRQRRWWAALSGASFAAAVAVRPTNLIPLVIVAVMLLIRLRGLLTSYVGGALVIIVPWLVLTNLAYGSFLQPYDAADHRTLQKAFLDALAANWVSPARGLLIFSPIVLLAVAGVLIARRRGGLDLLQWISLVAVPLYWILVSGFNSGWWAGDTYGPRFMSETLPFIFVLVLPFVDWLWGAAESFCGVERSRIRTWSLVVTLALVVVSVGINAEGGVLRSTTCWNGKPGSPTSVDNDVSRVWSWSDPQFLTGVRSLSSGSIHRSVLSTCQGQYPKS